MHTRIKILKFVVLFIVILLSTSLLAQIQPHSGPFLSNLNVGESQWLEKKNFDVQFYDGSDSLINQYLFEALRYRRNGNLTRGAGIALTFVFPPVGILGVAYGSQEMSEGVEYLRAATIRRYDLLLGGKTFDGTEKFRRDKQASWYLKENFHVEHYDGQSLLLNNMLNEAYRMRTKANNQFKVGLGTNVGGLGLMLIGLFSLAFGGYDAEPLITAGSLMHFSSYGFFISGLSKKGKSRKLLHQVTRSYYQQLNRDRSNTIKHLSD